MFITPDNQDYLIMEIFVQKTLFHPNIVQFIDAYQHNDQIWVALELMTGGSLTELIEGNITLQETHFAYIMKEMLGALQLMHDMHRIHRDIKSDNVLLGRHGEVKLGLFSYSILKFSLFSSISFIFFFFLKLILVLLLKLLSKNESEILLLELPIGWLQNLFWEIIMVLILIFGVWVLFYMKW